MSREKERDKKQLIKWSKMDIKNMSQNMSKNVSKSNE